MKKKLLCLFLLSVLFSCTQENISVEQSEQTELLSRKEIDTKIENSLRSTGKFNWSIQDANTIYSALKLGDDLLTVGYITPVNESAKTTSNNIKDNLVQYIRSNEPIRKSVAKSTELYVDEDLKYFDIKVTSKETIENLLRDSRVAFIEPASYQFNQGSEHAKSSLLSSFGCGLGGLELKEEDFRVVAPGSLVPWSFDRHNIPQAWNYSTGSGITIAVIDSGLSPEQKLMNENFNDGYSSGRTVEKYGTFIDSYWPWSNDYDGVDDKCGHGTSMTSVAAAPRNDDNLPVGVAYNANLVSYRAVEDVLINDYHEKRGVAEALRALGDRNDVKIISMSIGWAFTIKKVERAVKYAHEKGKMIVVAGGTSTSFTNGIGVTFPADMSETVAVGGVKENQPTVECDVCHKGPEIDFTVQMRRDSGSSIPVLSYYLGQTDYIAGTSAATAMTAGMAALVWSKNPNWTREQVFEKMKQSAEFYPNKNPDFGYGNINVLKAVQ